MKQFLFAMLLAIPAAAGTLSSIFSAPNITTVVDSSNSIYVAGYSSSANIPTTPGAYLPAAPGCASPACAHGFVAKISSSGTLIFATYLGTVDNGDTVSGIALDGAGNVFVAGQSTVPPTFPGVDPAPVGFIVKLAADGSKLLGSYSIEGGSPAAIAISPSGDVFATGQTVGQGLKCACQFVATAGAFQTAIQGATDAFAIRLDAALSHLIYSTIIGGSGADAAYGISVDAAGEAYITGSTSNGSSFPVAPAGYVQSPLPQGDVFVVKLNASGSALIFSSLFNPTIFSGFVPATGESIAVDESGIYVFGTIYIGNNPMPSDVYLATQTQFAAKLTPDGSSMVYQTPLPGPKEGGLVPLLRGIAVDQSGSALLLSYTDRLIPTTPDSFAPCTAAAGIPFVLQLDPTGAVGYASYLQGGLAIRGDGEVWYSDSSGVLNSFNVNDPLPPGVRCVADTFTGLIGPIAPGELVTLKGPGIGPDIPASQQLDSTGKVAVGLSGVNVYFNGIAAPLISVSASEIEAVVPFENLDPVEFPTATVAILKNGKEIDGSPVAVTAVAPVLMTDSQGCVSGFNSDGTLNSAANPAALGSLIAIFGEGAGLMSPAITGGIGNGQSRILAPVTAMLVDPRVAPPPLHGHASAPITILYAGDTPGFVEGLFELNLLLPKSFTKGINQENISIQIGNKIATACVFVNTAN